MVIGLVKKNELTRESSFEDIAQACIKRYYLIPYPGKPEKNKKVQVNRTFHGGVHAARTAMCAELFIDLYKKYAPSLVVNNNAEALTVQDIKLLKLAAVYHNSANISEIMADKEEHAKHFIDDMLLLGYKIEEIESFAQAITNKDSPYDTKNFFTKIIHDADCLEFIRCCSDKKNYKKHYLDIFIELKENAAFNAELDDIIDNHFVTIKMIEGNKSGKELLHVECESSDNCYMTLKSVMQNMFLTRAVLLAAENKKAMDWSSVNMADITVIDLFNRKNSPIIHLLIENHSVPSNLGTETDRALSLYQTGGILARKIDNSRIDDEIRVLETNIRIMRRESLETAEQMRQFLLEQNGKVFTPTGFKWRPCTFIEQDIPVSLYGKGIGILFDPSPASGTMVSHFYKKNIISDRAATGELEYYPEQSGKKDRGSINKLREKIHEQNRRRKGCEIDFNLHYYGQETLHYSETLGTYLLSSIRGIFTNLDKKSIQDALILQAKLGFPVVPIYKYSPENGLVRLSCEEIVEGINMSEIEIQLRHLEEKIGISGAIKFHTSNRIDGFLESYTYISFKSYHFFFDLSINSDVLAKIKKYMREIRELDLDRVGDEESMPLKVQLNQRSDGLQLTIDYLCDESDGEKIQNQEWILNLLSEWNLLLDSDLTVDEEENLEQLIRALSSHSDEVIEIQQKPDDPLKISPDNPLRYAFAHPVNHDISCECYVKNGSPIIEMHLPSGKTISKKTDKLPFIAKKYCEQAANRLQLHIKNEDVVAALTHLGVLNLKIHFESKGKSILWLAFDVASGYKKNDVKSELLSVLGLLKVKGINLKGRNPLYREDSEQVIFSIQEVQMIESFIHRLDVEELKARHPYVSEYNVKEADETQASGALPRDHQHVQKTEARALLGSFTTFVSRAKALSSDVNTVEMPKNRKII